MGKSWKLHEEKFLRFFNDAVVITFTYLGEELVAYARAMHTYKDRTGNLTNSMGYSVVVDGKIRTMFVGDTENDGAETKSLFEDLAANTKEKYALYVAAGMNYAFYVEARHFDVLMPAQLMAEQEVPKEVRKLMQKASRMLKDFLRGVK